MSNIINCLIVDDEPLAQKVIEKYLEDIPNFNVIAKCSNAFQAMEEMNNHKIDLIFLDINMPKLSGMTFLKTLKNPPMIIITTAYSEYALDSYELDVVDYLKKPFSFDRFFKSIQKVSDKLNSDKKYPPENNFISKNEENVDNSVISKNFIFIKANKKNYKVDIDDIFYIEALGDYIKVHTKDNVLVTYQSMKKMDILLPKNIFVRVHKSYIVSVNKIKSIEGNIIDIKNEKITIGNNFKQQLQDFIDKYSV